MRTVSWRANVTCDVGTFNGGNVWQQSPRETYYRHIIKINRPTSLLRFTSMTSGTETIGYFSLTVSFFLSFDADHRQDCRQKLPTNDAKTTDLTCRERCDLQSTPSNVVNVLSLRRFTLIQSRTREIFLWEGWFNNQQNGCIRAQTWARPTKRTLKETHLFYPSDRWKKIFVRTYKWYPFLTTVLTCFARVPLKTVDRS